MGKDRHREQKAIAAVACPTCGAPRGQDCRLRTEAERATARGRLLIHAERRADWQVWKRAGPVAIHLAGGGSTLVARSDDAYAALDRLTPASAHRMPDVRTVEVPATLVGALIVALTAADWRTG